MPWWEIEHAADKLFEDDEGFQKLSWFWTWLSSMIARLKHPGQRSSSSTTWDLNWMTHFWVRLLTTESISVKLRSTASRSAMRSAVDFLFRRGAGLTAGQRQLVLSQLKDKTNVIRVNAGFYFSCDRTRRLSQAVRQTGHQLVEAAVQR